MVSVGKTTPGGRQVRGVRKGHHPPTSLRLSPITGDYGKLKGVFSLPAVLILRTKRPTRLEIAYYSRLSRVTGFLSFLPLSLFSFFPPSFSDPPSSSSYRLQFKPRVLGTFLRFLFAGGAVPCLFFLQSSPSPMYHLYTIDSFQKPTEFSKPCSPAFIPRSCAAH